ncbi:hypothetical protein AB836_01745 [Rickettsiales bacterium (ex Bugula neritina AB1)]|nr:hypothetical protein AB836_01745 [Rickettsiales bacterium (ex Bugula neritina AB1)]
MYKVLDIIEILKFQIKKTINIKNNDRFKDISWISNKKIKKGLFIALKGKNTDGHLFVEDAYKNGYRLFLLHKIIVLPKEAKILLCEDTSIAFDLLARWGSQKFKGKFIGITGVAGKTSTTYLLANILQDYGYKVTYTFKYNTTHYLRHLLFSIASSDSDYCILELSSDGLGHIKYLGTLVDLYMSIIVSLGKSHLDGMKNEKGVYKEKLSIGSFTKNYLFINKKYEKNINEYKLNNLYKNIKYIDINYQKQKDKYILYISNEKIIINKSNYNIENIILILNLLKNMNIDIQKTLITIENICVFINRGNIIHYKNKNYDFIFHMYTHNANPISFINNIKYMNTLNVKYLCIKTDLLELNKDKKIENQKLFKFLVEKNENLLYIIQILKDTSYKFISTKKLIDHENIPNLINILKENNIQHIFVQGNRIIKLERYVEKIFNYLDTTE